MRIGKFVKVAAFAAATIMVLSGCSGGKGDNWGVDHANGVALTHGPLDKSTGLYRCNYPEDAMKVEKGGVVTPKTEDTQVRIWHFANSDEYVCLQKGDAYVTQP